MFFLFGEQIRATAVEAGLRECPVCAARASFSHVTETSFFTVFGLALLPIEKVADYHRCESFGNSFDGDSNEPTQVLAVKQVLGYVLVGYGMTDQGELAAEICQKVSRAEFTPDEVTASFRQFASGREDLFELLRRRSHLLNTAGKRQVIEAAFLATHACCEIQYEDRLRINLMGTALGMPLEFVQQCIEAVRSASYHGVRRVLVAN